MKLHLLLCPDCNSPNTDLSVWVSSIDPTPTSCNGSGECLDQVYCNTCDTTHKHRHCAQVTIDLEAAVLYGLKECPNHRPGESGSGAHPVAGAVARGIKAQVDEDIDAAAEADKAVDEAVEYRARAAAKPGSAPLVYRVEELEQRDYTRKGQVERLRDRLDELTGLAAVKKLLSDQETPAEPPRDQAADLRDQCMTIKDERGTVGGDLHDPN